MSTRCKTPFVVKHKMKNESIPVPCGKCPDCRARRASGWSFRLMQEAKKSQSAHFITLTYATENVVITKNGYLSLSKTDLQKFFKRLRKAHESRRTKSTQGLERKILHRFSNRTWNEPIKYYAVGEYGGKFKRPHYHVILFNAAMELIQDAWALGEVHYGTVTPASVGYTLKYISKGGIIPQHRNDDRLNEFSLMSKGLGLNYLTPVMLHWHKRDLSGRMYCNIENGKKIAMPRYYKNKIYNETEKKIVAFHCAKASVSQELLQQRKAGCFHADPAKRRRNNQRYFGHIAAVQRRKEIANSVKR